MSKLSRFAIFAVVVSLACGLAGIGYVVYQLNHHGEGPRHTYPLSGNAILTDEQAIALAKEMLQLDGRFSEAMELETFDDGTAANRGDDKTYVSLSWRYPGTNNRWYVQLHRTPERVEAVSYPGK
jgi:hypothetical protein